YHWQFNGANVAGATASSLTVNNVQAANAGTYRAIATNSSGSVTSAPAALRVIVPPSITQPSLTNNSFSFAFQSQTDATYVIQYNTNLSSTNWSQLLSTSGYEGTLTIRDFPTSGPSRFYRV